MDDDWGATPSWDSPGRKDPVIFQSLPWRITIVDSSITSKWVHVSFVELAGGNGAKIHEIPHRVAVKTRGWVLSLVTCSG